MKGFFIMITFKRKDEEEEFTTVYIAYLFVLFHIDKITKEHNEMFNELFVNLKVATKRPKQ